MSDDSRVLTGLTPRPKADPKRLLRSNRPEPKPADPTPPVEAEQPAAPAEPDTKPAEAAPAADRPPTQKPRAAAPAAGAKDGRLNTTIDPEVRSRAANAYQFTRHIVGEQSWNQFVEHALLELALRREQEYNDGEPFGYGGPLKAGRPLKL